MQRSARADVVRCKVQTKAGSLVRSQQPDGEGKEGKDEPAAIAESERKEAVTD